MKLVHATDRDNDKLLHYFAQATFPGPIQMHLRRMFNFFNQYRIQTDDFSTFMLLNDEDKIEAMASLLFRDGIIDGQKQKVGYATDLRVSPTRRAILSWAQHFLPVLEGERNRRDVKYLFSVVSHSQRAAYNTFIRPRNLRRRMPRYHLFRRFDLVSVHGIWPFAPLPLTGIKVRSAREGDFEQIAEYILAKTLDRPLRYYDTVEGFRESLEKWRDLKLENFLLAFDHTGKMIGCLAPWSPERVQRIYPATYGQKANNLRDILSVFSLFGIARRLPRENEELQLRFLTHLYADNPDIFYSLLYNAYHQAGKKEFLLYAHFENDLVFMPPKPFICADMEFGLYCVLAPGDPVPDFLTPKSAYIPPVFEPALI